MRITKLLSVLMVWGIFMLCLPSDAPAQQSVRDYVTLVSAAGLKAVMDSEKEILIIDTLPSLMYQRGHIPGAKHFEFPDAIINMERWDNSVMGGKSKEDFIALLGQNKDRPIVFYCLAEW